MFTVKKWKPAKTSQWKIFQFWRTFVFFRSQLLKGSKTIWNAQQVSWKMADSENWMSAGVSRQVKWRGTTEDRVASIYTAFVSICTNVCMCMYTDICINKVKGSRCREGASTLTPPTTNPVIHSNPIKFCCKASCFPLSLPACLPKLRFSVISIQVLRCHQI